MRESNFHDQYLMPIGDLPDIDVHILAQGGRPEGIGETAVPGMAPAIANAIFAATGKRLRSLPLGANLA